jgi:hypothetical protein
MSLQERRAATLVERLAAHRPALTRLAAEHDERAGGDFPAAAWKLLVDAGVPSATVSPLPRAQEHALLREVASVDVGLGRLLDGHLNAVQRLVEQVDDGDLVAAELDGVRAGRLRLGVWGADPGPGEGVPARLEPGDEGDVVRGVKTFCSGAGGLQRAFVLVRGDGDSAPVRLAYVDLKRTVVDDTWFRGAGMRSSASHRVTFDGARVLWLAAEPCALLRQPLFAGDAIRTAASWAGGADAAVTELVQILRAKGAGGDLEALAVARARTAQRTIDLWLAAGAQALDAGACDPAVAELAVLLRHAVAEATRAILDEAGRACGARAFAVGGALERARRDLETYLLQHRLEPLLVKAGRRALGG